MVRFSIVSTGVPLFRWLHLKVRGRAAVHLFMDLCTPLTLLNRATAKPRVRV